VLDFNRANVSGTPLSAAINSLIEAAEPPEENVRQYLGASTIGGECLRKIQFDWMCDPAHPTRTRDIFARGHFFEEVSRQHLIRAGFRFAPADRLGFAAANGLFRGHTDGEPTERQAKWLRSIYVRCADDREAEDILRQYRASAASVAATHRTETLGSVAMGTAQRQ
jgi:hypothetical protein